jgi:8-oxo-dGTP pyrophosphatase MutT (NUDIX family)
VTDELVAVYDAAGAVVGAAPRTRVYAEGLWHASAGVLVRSLDGRRLYVHRRTDTKAVFAGMHDCLAGGVVDPGETPERTARRELAEELGVTGVRLSPLAAASWDGQWAGTPMRCHLFAYEVRYDGPIRHQPEEIADGWWWTDAELARRLADPDWPFVPDTRILLPQLLAR